MATSTATLSLEKRLASIHKQLWATSNLAHDNALYGLGDDLYNMSAWVAHMIEQLLRDDPALKQSKY